MPVKKITISLDADLADQLRDEAEVDGATVSAWVSEAIRARVRSAKLEQFLDDYQAEHGAFTGEEMAETRAWLDESLSTQEPSSRSTGETVASPGRSHSSEGRLAS